MKKNIYLIIGHGRCGKSSLVRALTGKYKNGPCQIRSAYNTNMDFMVWANSSQDAAKSPEKVLKEINNVCFSNILLTLCYTPSPENSGFAAQDYVRVLKENHEISQILFMGEDEKVHLFDTSVPTNVINLCSDRPVNANANLVRQWWNWL
ncbi:MAG: hypothetical protein K0R65_1955 [Crocinitomicaceae bacterium]|jgi:energy-coupling factor transporter ATP-binding protein EcfA2|nr:hypothetical protein [Crocinitomicaceae bacterium]